MNKRTTTNRTSNTHPATGPLLHTLRDGDVLELIDKEGVKTRIKIQRRNGAWRARIFAADSTQVKCRNPRLD